MTRVAKSKQRLTDLFVPSTADFRGTVCAPETWRCSVFAAHAIVSSSRRRPILAGNLFSKHSNQQFPCFQFLDWNPTARYRWHGHTADPPHAKSTASSPRISRVEPQVCVGERSLHPPSSSQTHGHVPQRMNHTLGRVAGEYSHCPLYIRQHVCERFVVECSKTIARTLSNH